MCGASILEGVTQSLATNTCLLQQVTFEFPIQPASSLPTNQPTNQPPNHPANQPASQASKQASKQPTLLSPCLLTSTSYDTPPVPPQKKKTETKQRSVWVPRRSWSVEKDSFWTWRYRKPINFDHVLSPWSSGKATKTMVITKNRTSQKSNPFQP